MFPFWNAVLLANCPVQVFTQIAPLPLLKKKFYWNIVNSQSCFNFRSTANFRCHLFSEIFPGHLHFKSAVPPYNPFLLSSFILLPLCYCYLKYYILTYFVDFLPPHLTKMKPTKSTDVRGACLICLLMCTSA